MMMKSFLVLLVLTATAAFSANASASICKVDLKAGNGRLLQSFTGYGYSYNNACLDAKQDCNRVKRAGYYRARVQVCQERFVQTRGETCTAVMKNNRGQRVGTFVAQSLPRQRVSACKKALNQCHNAMMTQGRQRASCSILSQGPVRGGDRNRGGNGRGRGRG